MTQTVVVQIGNSDDKLSQAEWHSFCSRVHSLVDAWALQVHFAGYSPGGAAWQNACWVFTPQLDSLDRFEYGLARLAENYRQDSIALTRGTTEFVAAWRPGTS